MRVVGVDPGNKGAFALFDSETNSMSVIDVPIFRYETTKARTKIDAYGVTSILRHYSPDHVYIEEVFSSPQMGVTSAFNFGNGKGMLEGVCAALDLPLTMVKPTQWKREMRIPADKKAAVMRASQLMPKLAHHFRGPRGAAMDGRAEAGLLAIYGAMDVGCPPSAAVIEVEYDDVASLK